MNSSTSGLCECCKWFLRRYPDVAPVLVVVSRIVRRSLGTLDFLGAQTQKPDLGVGIDLLLLELRQPLLEVVQSLCNRKSGGDGQNESVPY